MARGKATTGPPDFVGVGAQRSGTTWWFKSLLEHPEIRSPVGGKKEQHYFTRFDSREMTEEDVAAYHGRFRRRPGQIAGEWTPRYMHDFWIPRLIGAAAPEAKILVMLRDPVERFRSGVPKERTTKRTRPFDEIVADAMERGRYASQLRHLRAELPGAPVLVIQYERCVAEPVAQYRRTLRFLGVDDEHPPPDFARPRGKSQASQKTELWPDLREALQATLEPEVRRLAATEPDIDVSLWPNFSHLADRGAAGAHDQLEV